MYTPTHAHTLVGAHTCPSHHHPFIRGLGPARRRRVLTPLTPPLAESLHHGEVPRPYTYSSRLGSGGEGFSTEFSGGLFLGTNQSHPLLTLPLPCCVTLRVTWPLGASIFSSVKWEIRGERSPETQLARAKCTEMSPPPPRLSSLQFSPTPDPGCRLPTHQPTRRPGGLLGARPSSAQRPALARSTYSWDPRQGARTRPGRRHLRALLPAGLAAAAAPARSPRCGPALRRPAPAPRLPPPLPAPARGSAPRAAPTPTRVPSRPARGGPCGSLTPPLPRRRKARAAGGGLRHWLRREWASGGLAPRDVEGGTKPRALSCHPRRPCAPRPAWCWAEEAGRGRKRTAVGKGRPAQPPARVPVFEKNRSHGATPAQGRGVFLRATGG